MMLLLLMLGCAHPAPNLFPGPLPVVSDPPAAEPFIPANDDCPKMAVKPGYPFPHVDDDGNATCRAVLVPEIRVHELLVAEPRVDYWHDVSQACYTARAADRRYAQTRYGVCWQQKRDAQRDAQVQRVVAGAAFVVGTATGLALGAGYARIAF